MSLLITGDLEVSKNILIVESENDKYFFQEVVNSISGVDIESLEAVCKIDDYECLGGISKLEAKLTEIKRRIKKDDISTIGIIFDANSVGIEKRKEQIETAVSNVLSDISDVEIKIHILNVDGHGELETVLRVIKSEESTYADCLNSWQECLSAQGKSIKDKDFDKFWVQVYQRYDCCTDKEQKQADRKCDNEASFKKPIWNLDHEVLDDLKKFLASFV